MSQNGTSMHRLISLNRTLRRRIARLVKHSNHRHAEARLSLSVISGLVRLLDISVALSNNTRRTSRRLVTVRPLLDSIQLGSLS